MEDQELYVDASTTPEWQQQVSLVGLIKYLIPNAEHIFHESHKQLEAVNSTSNTCLILKETNNDDI